MPKTVETIHPIDLHVGARIRQRRKTLGMSQEMLADGIGLTFQQVQKYERGSNRVSASKLYDIGKALKAPPQYFFDGFTDEGVGEMTASEVETAVHGFLMTTDGIALAKSFPLIRGAKTRRRILDLVQTLGGSND